jgi:hypothetical protein
MENLYYRNVGKYQDVYRQSPVSVCGARASCKVARKKARKLLDTASSQMV